MIIINGDSWGCGEVVNIDSKDSINSKEWQLTGERKVTHGGIAQYFAENNYNCVNISAIGSTNLESLTRLENFLIANQHLIHKISKIYVFQGEWSKDIQSFNNANNTYSQLKIDILNYFYKSLSDLAVTFNVEIFLLGGCSDVADHAVEFPKLSVACENFFNLVTGESTEKVYELFLDKPISDYIKNSKLSTDDKKFISIDIDNANERLELFKKHQNLFYPDGFHANRIAHKILFNHLIGNIA